MKAQPIIMRADSISAIRDGRKTQTRRVVKPQPAGAWAAPGKTACPYGQPGDLLWVRESHKLWVPDTEWSCFYRADMAVRHRLAGWDEGDQQMSPEDAGIDLLPDRWRSPIHMPRWASRLTLRLTDVRVERVQDISEEDAVAEGWNPPAEPCCGNCPMDDLSPRDMYEVAGVDGDLARSWFLELWDAINARRGHGWEANPWVWALTFEPIWQNVDEVETKHPAGAG